MEVLAPGMQALLTPIHLVIRVQIKVILSGKCGLNLIMRRFSIIARSRDIEFVDSLTGIATT